MADDPKTPSKPKAAAPDGATGEPSVDAALSEAQTAVDEIRQVADAEDGAAAEASGPNVDLPNFQQVLADVEATGIDLLHDVELNVKIELGRTHMFVEDVLRLGEGSVVELDKLAGDPVDVYVNERLVARGEVLVLNESFCVRISEIVASTETVAEDAKQTAGQQTG